MKSRVVVLAALFLSMAGAVSHAHHAGSAFDMTRELTIVGTVKEFKWVNPHTWLYLMVPDEKGELVEWKLEGGSISILGRAGWNAKILLPGEKITVTVTPLRSGLPGGEYRNVTKADGKTLGWGAL